jgi:hypothetical protein
VTEVSDWEALSGGLVEALRDLSDRAFLIVYSRTEPRVFVQFACGEHELHAEAAAAPEPGVLHASGWTPPIDNAPPNWSCSLPLPALTAEYTTLASRCVSALRDAHGLPDPDALVYKAWRDAEWPSAAADRDPGENPLMLPWLGIPSAHE